MVEETLENIVKDTLLNEDEDISKDSNDFVFSEKFHYIADDNSEPYKEKIENQLIKGENIENQNLNEGLKLEKVNDSADINMITIIESITFDSKTEKIDDDENSKIKSDHNSFEINTNYKLENLNENVQDIFLKKAEVRGKGKKRKNYKTKSRKRKLKNSSEKQDHVGIEKETQNSKVILQKNLIVNDSDRLENYESELLNEINQKSNGIWLPKNFGSNCIIHTTCE